MLTAVPDIFDEFLDELKRRQAGQRPGEEPAAPEPDGDGNGADDADDEPEPARRSGGGVPPRPRLIRRQSGGRRWPVVVAILGFLLLLFLSVGVSFWTDVLWYRSVGFESVLWTRVWSIGGLFVLGTLLGLAAILGNLAIA